MIVQTANALFSYCCLALVRCFPPPRPRRQMQQGRAHLVISPARIPCCIFIFYFKKSLLSVLTAYLRNKLYIYKPHAGREKGQKIHFCPWWPWTLTLTFKLVQARDHHICANLAQIRSAVRQYTNKKPTDWRRQKQNLPQFIACGKNIFHTKIIDSRHSYWYCSR